MAKQADINRRGVALDLDGVLIDGMPFHIAAWRDAFGHYGLMVDEQDLYALEGIPSVGVVDRLDAKYGLALAQEQRIDLAQRKKARYADIFEVVPLPEARGLIQELADFGYRLALVTGTTRAAGRQALTELGVLDVFTGIVSSSDVEAGKPAPDSYLAAVELLDVSARSCLAIENAPAGVESACTAGLPCVAVATYLPQEALRVVDPTVRVFADHTSLKGWIVDERDAGGGVGPFSLASSPGPTGG